MLPELQDDEEYRIELLTNRRLSHYDCDNRVLMPIYESVITSPFPKMAVYSLYNTFKEMNWPLEKVTAKTEKEYVFGKYPDHNTTFWLTVEIQNNHPERVASWLICPDKTALIVTLLIAKKDGDTTKHYTGLINWDPTAQRPFTDIVKRNILTLVTPASI